MDDDLKKFSNIALAALNGGDTNAGTDSEIVNNYSRAAFGDVLGNAASGTGAVAGTVATAQANAAKAALQKLQDENDPSKYQKIRKDDGGFEFLDSQGNPIDVSTYASKTGLTRAEALKDSENPLDQQFVNDYNNAQDLATDINNGDSAKIATFLQNNKGIDAKTKPQDLIADLIKKYPHIFGKGTYADSLKNLNNPVFSANQIGGVGPSSSSGGTGISASDYGY